MVNTSHQYIHVRYTYRLQEYLNTKIVGYYALRGIKNSCGQLTARTETLVRFGVSSNIQKTVAFIY
jgi:hypothetical protein